MALRCIGGVLFGAVHVRAVLRRPRAEGALTCALGRFGWCGATTTRCASSDETTIRKRAGEPGTGVLERARALRPDVYLRIRGKDQKSTDVSVINALLSGVMTGDKRSRVMAILREMKSRSITPTATTYELLLRWAGEDAALVAEVQDVMSDVEPNSKVIVALIRSCGLDYHRALKYFQLYAKHKIVPDVWAFEALLSTCEGDSVQGCAVLDLIKKYNWSEEDVRVLFKPLALSLGSTADGAIKCLEEAESLGLPMSADSLVTLFLTHSYTAAEGQRICSKALERNVYVTSTMMRVLQGTCNEKIARERLLARQYASLRRSELGLEQWRKDRADHHTRAILQMIGGHCRSVWRQKHCHEVSGQEDA